MSPRKFGYINDVDQLIESTSIDKVLAHYNMPLAEKTSGEHRMKCVFDEACSDSQYGNLTVRLDDTVNRIFCHTCNVRGNLLTLIHGLERHEAPAGGRLRGEEFKSAVAKLREIADDVVGGERPTPKSDPAKPIELPVVTPVNTPMVRHEKEQARTLANLHEELVVDVADMSPEAAQYVRKRPWMTPELIRKWGVGWIPGDGRSLFRKGYFVYTHRNERGDVVSYSGRDLAFESKWKKWIRDGKPEGKKPNKHRYVSGYHRGLELYGGQAGRMKEEYVRDSLQQHGLVVVEGMNDVLRMEDLDVAAVGIGSNKATEAQIDKLVRFARQAANNRITLFPDCDTEGESAFKELMWNLAENRVKADLGWSSNMQGGKFAGSQPEDLDNETLQRLNSHVRQKNWRTTNHLEIGVQNGPTLGADRRVK